MQILSAVFLLIGGVIGLIYGIQFLIVAFKASVLWGLGCLFIPFVGLIFLITHWADAKKPFLRSLIAIPFYLAGGIMSGMAASGS